jgi:hypothetical protein
VPPPHIYRHRSEIGIDRHVRKIQSSIAEPQPQQPIQPGRQLVGEHRISGTSPGDTALDTVLDARRKPSSGDRLTGRQELNLALKSLQENHLAALVFYG